MKKETVNLSNICIKVTDGTHDSPKLQKEGVPFIKGKHISDGHLDFKNCDYITYEDHLEVIKRSKPEQGDILFSNIGTLGSTVFINTKKEFSIKNVALFKPNRNKIFPRYLYYVIKSPAFHDSLLNRKFGVAQPFIPLDELRSFEFEIFEELNYQKKIAGMLANYDDLIDNNTRRIQLLEQMAKLIYDEWFIKFKFPGHKKVKMVESRLGEIPKGWEVKSLIEVSDFVMGLSPKGKSYNLEKEGTPLLNGPGDFSKDGIRPTKYTTEPTRICKTNDILLCIRGSIGNVTFSDAEYCIGRGVAAVRAKKQNFSELVYFALNGAISELTSKAGGAVIIGITKEDLETVKILCPDMEIASSFSKVTGNILKMGESLKKKNLNLAATRDLLLPKLISGELDVSELDIKVPEVEA